MLIVALAVTSTLAVALLALLIVLTAEFRRREVAWGKERDDLVRQIAPGYRWQTQAPPTEFLPAEETDDDVMAAEWGSAR